MFDGLREDIATRLEARGLGEKLRQALDDLPEDSMLSRRGLLIVSREPISDSALPEIDPFNLTIGYTDCIGLEINEPGGYYAWNGREVAHRLQGADTIPADPDTFDEADVNLVMQCVQELGQLRRDHMVGDLPKCLRKFGR